MRNLTVKALILLLFSSFSHPAYAQTQEQVQMANNPLAQANALGMQNYFTAKLYGLDNLNANTFMIRPVVVTPRMVIRATVPIVTAPQLEGDPISGLSDINIFGTYVWFIKKSMTDIGIGPLAVFPTATDSVLGAGKYQLGAAFILVQPLSKTVLTGTLLTWQTSVANANSAAAERPSTSLMNFQPFLVFQIGGGFTLKSTAIWMFDFTNGHYSIPIGFGVGKVLVSGRMLISMGLEPQFTFLHNGLGQPQFQLFAGLNFQIPAKPRKAKEEKH
jgi:hypothetical protein